MTGPSTFTTMATCTATFTYVDDLATGYSAADRRGSGSPSESSKDDIAEGDSLSPIAPYPRSSISAILTRSVLMDFHRGH